MCDQDLFTFCSKMKTCLNIVTGLLNKSFLHCLIVSVYIYGWISTNSVKRSYGKTYFIKSLHEIWVQSTGPIWSHNLMLAMPYIFLEYSALLDKHNEKTIYMHISPKILLLEIDKKSQKFLTMVRSYSCSMDYSKDKQI